MLNNLSVIKLLPLILASQLPPVPELPSQTRGDLPRLYIEQRLYELGAILDGDKPTIIWRLENRGKAPLIIDRTRATCGCTLIKLTDAQMTIAPGKSLDLEVVFDSTGRGGVQNKSIKVFTNDPAEPILKLEFTATVETLFEVDPPGFVNLRAVRRGELADRIIHFLPGSDHGTLKILSLEGTPEAPLTFSIEPYSKRGRTGLGVRMTLGKHVELGTLNTKLTASLEVDGIERKRTIPIRVEVIGDLTWRPRVVDSTRQAARPGKRFAPVTIRSTDRTPFVIDQASAGKWFDVKVTTLQRGAPGTHYSVALTLREDAPVGPFGTTLKIETSSLDQPVVRIPVFGIVAPLISVDPPLISFRQDGTAVGQNRRVKLMVSPQLALEITEIKTDHKALVGRLDETASARYSHLAFIEVSLVGKMSPGIHTPTLIVTTNVPGMKYLKVLMRVDVPKPGG